MALNSVLWNRRFLLIGLVARILEEKHLRHHCTVQRMGSTTQLLSLRLREILCDALNACVWFSFPTSKVCYQVSFDCTVLGAAGTIRADIL